MVALLDPLLIVVLALDFIALGVSRIRGVIRCVALQGMVIGVLPLLVHSELGLRGWLLVLGAIVLKGFVLPSFIIHAMREADIQHEVRPIVGFVSSLLLGAAGAGLALVLLSGESDDPLLVPTALATVWTGILLLTTRRKAIMQVLGYLVLENGIFLFGLLLLEAMPFLVEVGVLLDLFTGVFVMGIIVHHISREFSSISTEFLSELKD
jgi:hydrogenase-4 component E